MMIKFTKLLLIIFSMMILVGCGGSKVEDSNPPTSENDLKEEDNSKPTITTTEKDLRIFFYDAVADTQEYSNRKVSISNGAVVNAVFNELLKLDSNYISPKDTTVKSAVLSKEKSKVTIDFSGQITPDNLGGGVESAFLTSLVNSFGYNLDVKTVVLTINGEPYTSGHFLKGDEGFTVSYEGWNEKK